jgi:4-hydroxymandelate synthase
MFVEQPSPLIRLCRDVVGLNILGTYSMPLGETLVLEKADIRILLTAPSEPESETAHFLALHGEGVRDVAFTVDDLDSLCHRARSYGGSAVAVQQHGAVPPFDAAAAEVGGVGDVVHTLVESRKDVSWTWNIRPNDYRRSSGQETRLTGIDHVAFAVRSGDLETTAAFYMRALGFYESMQEDVLSAAGGMRSKVIDACNGIVRFTIVEPASAQDRSQVARFVERNGGAGVQHVAFATSNILESVAALSGNGLEFLAPPRDYYDNITVRIGDLPYPLDRLKKYGVFVDCDAAGILLQVFSKPVTARNTLFIELIERRGAVGFGRANIRALYEAVERA